MICKNCNMNNSLEAKFCTNCGQKLEEPQPIIQNNMNNSNNMNANIPVYNSASAIIALILSVLCCGGQLGLIFSILSLVEGSKVKQFVSQGNIQAANMSLDQAKKWDTIAWIVIGICVGLSLLYFLFSFGLAFMEGLSGI